MKKAAKLQPINLGLELSNERIVAERKAGDHGVEIGHSSGLGNRPEYKCYYSGRRIVGTCYVTSWDCVPVGGSGTGYSVDVITCGGVVTTSITGIFGVTLV